jgi:hypothetical protein
MARSAIRGVSRHSAGIQEETKYQKQKGHKKTTLPPGTSTGLMCNKRILHLFILF